MFVILVLPIVLLLIWIMYHLSEYSLKRSESKRAPKSKYLSESPIKFKLIKSSNNYFHVLDDKMEHYLSLFAVNEVPLFELLDRNYGSIPEFSYEIAKYNLDRLNGGLLYFEVDESNNIKVRDNKGIYCIKSNFDSSFEEYLKLKYK